MTGTSVDLVVTQARIHTMGERGTVESMAVQAGRVVAVGREVEELIPDARAVLDLEGATVMPGLVDVHNHHSLAGQMDLFELSFPPTASLEAVLDAVSDHAATLAAGEWVVGGSWGSGLLDALDSPDALRRLDAAGQGHPVLLKDDSKHNRWANSAAMTAAGISADSVDPDGGMILRDADGQPTGVMIEAAGAHVEKVRERLFRTTTEDLARASARGIEMLHAHGITAFQDAAASLQLMTALHELDEQGGLHAWVVTSMLANDFIFGADPLGEDIIAGRERTRSLHHRPDFIKIFLDGVPPAGTGAFLEPYLKGAGFPACHHGHTTMGPEELERWLLTTAARGISAKVHCTGDASVRMVLDAVARVRAAGHVTPRYHVAHGQFIHPDDVARFASLDVVADISPALWYPGVITQAIQTVLGEERGSRLHPNRALVDAGALVAGGSDWPVSESPNVWESVYGLVTRKDPTGRFPGELWPEQALTREEALRVYTTAGAAAMGLDDTIGSLDAGRSADFVVLSADPLTAELESIPGITAKQTWFAGRRVHETQ
ncbi:MULTISPECIES: amidohydrolase [Micrococcus]|uniref:Amidohydrolase 3 domain-containing protein n=1 Tax=Micrococcus luteus TaxID=1270 RepID=A0ABD7M8Z4_MICLU|nr:MULTISPECIES: amidohydrolase [Micrococcus]CVN06696.1 N-substituted formamide deformylase precursor [Streptococcus pneumoniae]MCV7695776.1 amidohydrolase [Micrococcus luteus]MDK7870247.1 amidohydrolase [Micrococcus luteus]MDK8526010.1 amidohydrolase [Micrococcus luteus]MDK8728408.1 amidohydrolase [Micrococcus luteus]